MLYAQVIVKRRTNVSELTYALSAQIIPYVKIGSLVTVPLRAKQVTGVVVGFQRRVPAAIKGQIKEISQLAKNSAVFSGTQIDVIKRLAVHYAAPLAEVAFHALDQPQIFNPGSVARRYPPLLLTGAWAQRRLAYWRIIGKSTSRVLFIFAQQSYLADFKSFLSTSGVSYPIYDLKSFTGRRKLQELMSRLQNEEKVILLGTLGEVFFPLVRGDIMVVDQPTHAGAKSQTRPFMTSRQIALTRGEVEGLGVVQGDCLVSPTDLLAAKAHQMRLVSSAPNKKSLTIFDRRGHNETIIPSLADELAQTLAGGERALVLVLARGWASALVCQECGLVNNCSHCSRATAVWGSKLLCRYCGTEQTLPVVCPNCHQSKLKAVGEGVSAVRSVINQHFPHHRVSELSSDQPRLETESQIVVATEKILSFPTARFDRVFIVSADRLLSGAHLDGSWRLLNMLVELKSRTERISVQTYFPDSVVWIAAAGDVRRFFSQELAWRQRLHLPPYGEVISVRGSAGGSEELITSANRLIDQIAKLLAVADITSLEIDGRSGRNYHGHFNLFLPKPSPVALKKKLADTLPPNWHLDLD